MTLWPLGVLHRSHTVESCMRTQHCGYFCAAGLRADSKHLPNRLWEVEQIVEFTGAAEPLAAINDHTFSIHVGSGVREEIHSEVGEFIVTPKPLHGMGEARVLLKFLGGHQAGPSALCGKGARGDGIQPNVVTCPFHGERASHGQHPRFCTRGWDDECRTAIQRRRKW